MSKRVLILTYPFPPVGGAGVQRVTKFVKYLPAFGWQSSVLTAANPSVPLYDQSLGKDIPEGTIVRRARTWEPGYGLKAAVAGGTQQSRQGVARRMMKGVVRGVSNLVLQPDPQILWMPPAVRAGVRLLREVPHQAILATAPPFSCFLIAAALSKRTGLPLVLDYRDEWDISNAYWENKRLDPLSRFIQSGMQRRVVRRARALIATTRHSARSLEKIRDSSGSAARVTWIYNGYDPDDFPPSVPDLSAERGVYRLAYVGTLWNLTSVAPLVQAVEELARRRPEIAPMLELVFVGRRTGEQQQFLDRLRGLPCRLVEHAYLDHSAAVDVMRSADGLCALLSDLPHMERVVPAKIFEYMALRRSILVIAPHGELWELVRDYPAGRCFEPRDVEGITNFLADEVRRHKEGGQSPPLAGWDGSQYDRRHQAGQLAEILNSVAGASHALASGG